MGNHSSQFDYSDFVEIVNSGIKINGLPSRDQRLLDNFFSILQGTLINDPPNLELPWLPDGSRIPTESWLPSGNRSASDHFGWTKSYIAVRRNVSIKIADIYNHSKGDRKKSFNDLNNLTQKQLAHFYTMIMLMDGLYNQEDLSELLQNSNFSEYLFHDGTSVDYQKIDHWLKFLSKVKTEKNPVTRHSTGKGETRHFVKREELREEEEKEKEDPKPQTLEEYLEQILFKMDALYKMYQRLERKLDDEKPALRKKAQS